MAGTIEDATADKEGGQFLSVDSQCEQLDIEPKQHG
jgi:hypothetical protein